MSERPAAAQTTDATPIRDAACVVLVDYRLPEPALLMGRRHADQVFLPDKWVFPGGRVDDFDRRLAADYPLTYAPADLAPAIRAFAVAAVRELNEETGVLVGQRSAPPDFEAFCAGDDATRYYPHTAKLYPLARAITPPGRVRRYDTWFFLADAADADDAQHDSDGELIGLDWFTLSRARRLDLPNITRLILDDVAMRLAGDADTLPENAPFYWPDSSGFRRTYASCRGGAPTP